MEQFDFVYIFSLVTNIRIEQKKKKCLVTRSDNKSQMFIQCE